MDKARIFKTNEIVTAQDVLDGKINKNDDFVDVEEDFKVTFVKKAKNNGRPYFRVYYSLEDYKELSPEQKTRYDILSEMRHYQETPWHRDWKALFEPYAEIEKVIINPETKKRKIADAFFKETKICVEFQHSYIANDFEERNAFYRELGIDTFWLYDLTGLNVKLQADGSYQILENNAKGFFKIAENQMNLLMEGVFIQAKDKLIYRINYLDRKEIDNEFKSTIRCFYPAGIYNSEEFIEYIRNYRSVFHAPIIDPEYLEEQRRYYDFIKEPHSLYELWKPSFNRMVVQNIEDGQYILIDRSIDGKSMKKAVGYKTVIAFHYVKYENHWYDILSSKEYGISDDKASREIWMFMRSY
ncbi:MAG: hypothetical protein IJJ00_03010 [Erysipelotrichaceae bacterium]|nr:hypothetical protein [Erysipelotrichaceae bacterium]